MRLIRLALCFILISSAVQAETLFEDKFDTSPDWDGRTDAVSSIISDSPNAWTTIWPTQTDTRHGEINSAYGNSGKGFRFSLDSSGGPAQESCIFSGGSLSQPSLFWAYRWKCSTLNWGTGGKILKMTRFYASPGPADPGIIPEWNGTSMTVAYGIDYAQTATCYTLTDTEYHSYLWQFERGTNANDGVIRLWVDGSQVFEDTDVDWEGTGTNFTYNAFPIMQGNMSGNYNGGELFTYWDDYGWYTTLAEAQAALGLDGEPAAVSTVTGMTSCDGCSTQ